jgi:hypothetical protein
MAAVAGSKGRLQPRTTESGSIQLEAVTALLNGRLDAEGAAHKLLADSAVREVGIDTNMICNLACQYCYLSDRVEEPGKLPLDQLHEKLTELAAFGTKLFAFIGKEPLADKRAVTLLKELNLVRGANGGFRTGLVTNGTLVERRLDQLVEADVSYIDISVDGLGEAENSLRGGSVISRIKAGIRSVIQSPLRERFATATVLTGVSAPRYPDFVKAMFDQGVVTCFASPVLRFAMSNEVSEYAVSLDHTLRLADHVASATVTADPCTQVIIDLPYRYTWSLLRSGGIPVGEVQQDAFEALYWQLLGSSVFIKLNPFPFSYWRAVRITHDGNVILNMDLAAHEHYSDSAARLEQLHPALFQDWRQIGILSMTNFIEGHLGECRTPIYERDLSGQYARSRSTQVAA